MEKVAPHSREEANATRLKSQSATVLISIWSSITGLFLQTIPRVYAFKRDVYAFKRGINIFAFLLLKIALFYFVFTS